VEHKGFGITENFTNLAYQAVILVENDFALFK